MQETRYSEPEKKKPKKSRVFKLIRVLLLGTVLILTTADSNASEQDHSHNLNHGPNNSLYDRNSTVDPLTGSVGGNKEDKALPQEITDETLIRAHEQEDEKHVASEPVVFEETELYQEVTSPILFGEGEYLQYIIDNYNEESVGIPFDGSNALLSPAETNAVIHKAFSNDSFMRSVVTLYYPEKSDDEITKYLEDFKILTGEKIDYYLTTVRHGSWGTTVATVTADGEVRFETISLRSDFVSQNYTDDEWGSLTRLVREEFFQAHQYNVFARLFNSGYLSEVAGTHTVDDMVEAVSDERIRSFLELFSQQKMLTDSGAGGNAYNFYIGDTLFEGNPAAKVTVDAAYNTLASFIENKLGIVSTPQSFLNEEFIVQINTAFRDTYSEYYSSLGFHQDEINIWNLVGMKRNSYNSANSLDMHALLPLPTG